MATTDTDFDYEAEKAEAETLHQAVLAILEQHVGAQNAIQASTLAKMLGLSGKYPDRRVRLAISQLRQQGHLILSSVRGKRGYFMAANEREFEEFCRGHLRRRALAILATYRRMVAAARQQWGEAVQLELLPSVQ